MIKRRVDENSNYLAVWVDGKTIRKALDPSRPITDLKYPEFWDIKITNNCLGLCPWCYQDSKPQEHTSDIIEKLAAVFVPMSENQRPFQVAIGGGEPLSHPDFWPMVECLNDLGIVVNYTTNGMLVDALQARLTAERCGGVAVSTHRHLWRYWENAAWLFYEAGMKPHLHHIISDIESIDYFEAIFTMYKNMIERFVFLPHTGIGRADVRVVETAALFDRLQKYPDRYAQFSFGAGFYEALKADPRDFDVSLYEPEIFSKYLDLETMKVWGSSFDVGLGVPVEEYFKC